MKLFNCTHCGQLIYFENSRCEQCGFLLGFVTEKLQLLSLNGLGNGNFSVCSKDNSGITYRYCANHEYGVCNWMVRSGSVTPFCKACTLNRTIPNLNKLEYLNRWITIENAKHRLVYTLLRLKLPVISKTEDRKKGLSFDFMADENPNGSKKVLTGHADGVITINIAEANDLEREMARKAMDEVYRTVLGHFRHEVGHYYWDRLIDNSQYIEPFRRLFGDERVDYGEALKKHYKEGAPVGWNQRFISAYASTHPWEDWAETWAHYLHIIDTLETAYSFGISVHPNVENIPGNLIADMKADPYSVENFDTIINLWLPLTFTMNSINRSMGLHDLYPFVINQKVIEKLRFIHQVCLKWKQERDGFYDEAKVDRMDGWMNFS
jgi:hypothetical protein